MTKYRICYLLIFLPLLLYAQSYIRIDTIPGEYKYSYFNQFPPESSPNISAIAEIRNDIYIATVGTPSKVFRFDGTQLFDLNININKEILQICRDENDSIYFVTTDTIYHYNSHQLIVEDLGNNHFIKFAKNSKVIFLPNQQLLFAQKNRLYLYQRKDNTYKILTEKETPLAIRHYFEWDGGIYFITYKNFNFRWYQNRLEELPTHLPFLAPGGEKLYGSKNQMVYQIENDSLIPMFKTAIPFFISKIVPLENNQFIILAENQLFLIGHQELLPLSDINKAGHSINNLFFSAQKILYATTDNGFFFWPFLDIRQYSLDQTIKIKAPIVQLGTDHWIAILKRSLLEFKNNQLMHYIPIDFNKKQLINLNMNNWQGLISKQFQIGNATNYFTNQFIFNDHLFFIHQHHLLVYDKKTGNTCLIEKETECKPQIVNYMGKYYISHNDTNYLFIIDIPARQMFRIKNPFREPLLYIDPNHFFVGAKSIYSNPDNRLIPINSAFNLEEIKLIYPAQNRNGLFLCSDNLFSLQILKLDTRELKPLTVPLPNLKFASQLESLKLYAIRDSIFILMADTIAWCYRENSYQINCDTIINSGNGNHLHFTYQENDSSSFILNSGTDFYRFNSMGQMIPCGIAPEPVLDQKIQDTSFFFITKKGYYRTSWDGTQISQVKRILSPFADYQFLSIIDSLYLQTNQGVLYVNPNQHNKSLLLNSEVISGAHHYYHWQTKTNQTIFLLDKGLTQFNRQPIANIFIQPDFRFDSVLIMPDNEVHYQLQTVSPGYKNFLFFFTIQSYQGPYQLYYSINDQPWLESNRKDQIQLFGIGPGRYRIRVNLEANHFVQSSKQWQMEFVIDRPFWEKWYYQVLIVFSLGMIGFIVIRRWLNERLKKNRIEAELSAAKKMQQLMLPIIPTGNEHLDFFIEYRPSFVAGGDFYEIIWRDEDELLVLLGDISGHGLEASLNMAHLKGIIDLTLQQHLTVEKFLFELNQVVYKKYIEKYYATLVVAQIHIPTKNFEVYSAGHPSAIHYRHKTHTIEEIKNHMAPLGFIHPMILRHQQCSYEKNDYLLLYTDGITEVKNSLGEQLQPEGLIKLFQEIIELNDQSIPINTQLTKKIVQFSSRQSDDQTFIIIHFI